MHPQPVPASATPASSPPSRRQVPVLAAHLTWEAVLLVLVAVVIAAAAVRTELFGASGDIWWSVASGGLVASGLALSLRTRSPNLAVAGMAGAGSALYGVLVIDGGLPALAAALLAVAATGLAGAMLGLVAGLTSVPAWAVSLAGLALTDAFVLAVAAADAPVRPVAADLPLPDDGGTWFVVFLVGSLAGGALFAVTPVGEFFSGPDDAERVRAGGGPTRVGVLGAVVGFAGSSVLGGLAGLVLVLQYGSTPGSTGLFQLLLALAAVLIGGVSAFGGRGGIAGTALGVLLVTVLFRWIENELVQADADLWLRSLTGPLVVGLAILAGVGVSRALAAIAPAGAAGWPAGAGRPAGSPRGPGHPAEDQSQPTTD